MTPVDPNERHTARHLRLAPHGTAQRQLLLGPLADLISDLDKIRGGAGQSPGGSGEQFAMWQDGENLFIEAELPGEAPALDIDVTVLFKKVFIRMGIWDDKGDAPGDG